jgi:hypothetical protein
MERWEGGGGMERLEGGGVMERWDEEGGVMERWEEEGRKMKLLMGWSSPHVSDQTSFESSVGGAAPGDIWLSMNSRPLSQVNSHSCHLLN